MNRKLERRLIGLMAKHGMAKDNAGDQLVQEFDAMRQMLDACRWERIVGVEIAATPQVDGSLGYIPSVAFRDGSILGQPRSMPLPTHEAAEQALAAMLHIVRFEYPSARKARKSDPLFVEFTLFDLDLFVPLEVVGTARAEAAEGKCAHIGANDSWVALTADERVARAGMIARERLAVLCPHGMDPEKWGSMSNEGRDLVTALAAQVAAAGKYVLREGDRHR